MQRFLKGFLWNFVVLLLVFTGFRMWTSGITWAAFACLIAVLIVAAMRFRKVRQQLRDQNQRHNSE